MPKNEVYLAVMRVNGLSKSVAWRRCTRWFCTTDQAEVKRCERWSNPCGFYNNNTHSFQIVDIMLNS